MNDNTIGLMQPFFLPYIGYFQLMNAVDFFIVLDNVEYSKKSYVKRNILNLNGKDKLFSIPIKKSKDNSKINELILSEKFRDFKIKFYNQFKTNYYYADYYDEAIELLNEIFSTDEIRLSNFLVNQLKVIAKKFEMNTTIATSSDYLKDNYDTKEERIFDICKKLESKIYINAIGGRKLYSKEFFSLQGIDLKFIQKNIVNKNIGYYSILNDVAIYGIKTLRKKLYDYELV